MTYKTVLVHCNDKRRVARVTEAAAAVAHRFQAHLIGLSVTPPVAIIPSGMPGAPDAIVIDDHCVAYRKDNAAMRAAFEAAAVGQSSTVEWQEADADNAGVAGIVLPLARAADLVVAAQSEANWQGSPYLDIADRLAVESGRPVLIVPNEGVHMDFGKKVLVAWNARREAARAVFDALPLLQQADEVKVVWVNPQAEGAAPVDVPAGDICAALARHGVKCEATEVAHPHTGVGRTLLARAAEYGSDLLVMGCYGHSRLREFVLGGASRHVLEHMTIPVLMSH
jgi:nucleotide-binding universal stress UspA family protein